MKALRRLLRRSYNYMMSFVLLTTMDRVYLLRPRRLKEQLGPADTLRIAAAGTSILESDKGCGPSDRFHVLGVNYFSELSQLHLWSERTVFVIEPHPTYQLYAESMRRAAEIRQPCFVIVKGFGSHKKVRSVYRLVRALSAIPDVIVLLSNDSYVTDLPANTYAQAIADNPDRVICGSKSLLWALSYGYVAGYKKIVLHGFDFSTAYAYRSPTDEAGQPAIRPNTWTGDTVHRDIMLREVSRLAQLLGERGVELLHGSCTGPLVGLLPLDAPAAGPA